jgi:hypothetical protein
MIKVCYACIWKCQTFSHHFAQLIYTDEKSMSVAVHICHPSTWEAEAGGSSVWG